MLKIPRRGTSAEAHGSRLDAGEEEEGEDSSKAEVEGAAAPGGEKNARESLREMRVCESTNCRNSSCVSMHAMAASPASGASDDSAMAPPSLKE